MATTRDLDHLSMELRPEFRAGLSDGLRGIERELHRGLAELHRELKMQLIAMIGIVGTGVAVATGLGQLL